MITKEEIEANCDEIGECLIWKGPQSEDGYPVAWVGRVRINVRRHIWKLANGLIRKGLVVVDTCDNRLCCGENHLKINTKRQSCVLAAKRGKLSDPLRKVKCAIGARAVAKKLNQDKADALRARYLAKEQTGELVKDLAAEHGLSTSMVRLVGIGRCWNRTYEAIKGSSIFNMGNS